MRSEDDLRLIGEEMLREFDHVIEHLEAQIRRGRDALNRRIAALDEQARALDIRAAALDAQTCALYDRLP